MLNPNLKLNTKVFNDDVEKKATRTGFGEGLLRIGDENENIVVLSADLEESTKVNLFAERYPKRFIEVGVAEQNLATVASGLASMGKVPFIASYAMFNPGRNWEQIRTTICYNNQPVKIIGSHSGTGTGEDGGSHQAFEDIAITRVIPNMVVISPCDYTEAKKATIAISKTKEPSYIRLTRNNTPKITTENTPFEIGKAQIIWNTEIGLAHIGIIATGPILYKAIKAAKDLEKEGIKVKVMNMATIKPLDKESIISLAKETKAIITCEDHQIIGGLGGAVAECLSESYPTFIEFVGIKNKFGQSGTPEELEKYYEIDTDSIISAARKIFKKRINL